MRSGSSRQGQDWAARRSRGTRPPSPPFGPWGCFARRPRSPPSGQAPAHLHLRRTAGAVQVGRRPAGQHLPPPHMVPYEQRDHVRCWAGVSFGRHTWAIVRPYRCDVRLSTPCRLSSAGDPCGLACPARPSRGGSRLCRLSLPRDPRDSRGEGFGQRPDARVWGAMAAEGGAGVRGRTPIGVETENPAVLTRRMI
jgi:hypothetical protein